jgi:hypothetical protein
MSRLAAFLCVASLSLSSAKTVSISNTEQRRDTHGVLMDAHDGNVVQFESGGLYFMYAMEYGNYSEGKKGCDQHGAGGIGDGAGFRSDHNVSVWTSPDLSAWSLKTREGLAIVERPLGIYFRPKVVYNARTKLYVMWVNYMDYPAPYHRGWYLSATSKSPLGPFSIANPNITMTQKHGGSVQDGGIFCDFDLMVDDDGQAYNLYGVWKPAGPPQQATHISVERLTSDYLSSALEASAVFTAASARADEAPAIFKRKGVYYALFGHGCCFCAGGAGVNVFTSLHPLGPYSAGSYDIGCAPDAKTGVPPDISRCNSTVHAQQNCIFDVALANGTVLQVWTGDRWQSAPDRLKSHDFQFWSPLQWDDSRSPPVLQHLQWTNSFQLEL